MFSCRALGPAPFDQSVSLFPPTQFNMILFVVCKLSSYSRKHRLLLSIPSPEVQKQRFTQHAKRRNPCTGPKDFGGYEGTQQETASHNTAGTA